MAATASVVPGCALIRGGASHESVTPAPASGNEVRITKADLARVTPAEPLLIELAEPKPKLLVARDAEGGYIVVQAECTHNGCVIDWSGEVKEWQCPCHGSRFAVDGKVVEGPAEAPIKRYEARLDGDDLLVNL